MAGKTIAQHRQDILLSLGKAEAAFGAFHAAWGARWMKAAETLRDEGKCRILPLDQPGQYVCVPPNMTFDLKAWALRPIP